MGTVRNILQSKGSAVFSIPSSTTIYQALEIMSDKNIGALLVVDNDECVGIVTERDYARKVILKGKSSKDTTIGEIMTENPTMVTPETSIEDCMKLMSGKKFRHLPVKDNNRLVGIISVGDLVKFIIEEQQFIIQNLEQYIAR